MGFAISHNFFVIAFLFALYGVYQGIFRAVGKAYAADFVPPELRASGVGWFNTTVGISGLVAGLSAGLIYDKIGHSFVFMIAAIFVALGSLLLLSLQSQRRL